MEKTTGIRFSIIVPTHNRPEMLHQLLDSIRIQNFDAGAWEILVVDNAPDDEQTKELVERFQSEFPQWNLRYVREPEKGMMRARNRGVAEARGDVLIFLDDDVLLHQDYMERAQAELPGLAPPFAGGGRIIPVFEHQKPPWLTKFFMPLLAEINLGEQLRLFPKKRYPFGINMLVHRSVFDRFGLFPVQEARRGEDWLSIPERRFFAQLKEENIPIYYLPNLTVWHLLPAHYARKRHIRRQAEIHYRMELADKRAFHGWRLLRTWGREGLKWVATLGVGFYYLMTTQWEKIKPVFQYRYWISHLLLRCSLGKERCSQIEKTM